ncbi:MAG: hypothetical protein AAGG01_12575 [Planctomycetota bacterium]
MEDLVEVGPKASRTARLCAGIFTALTLGILTSTGALEIALPPSKLRLVGDEADRSKAASADLSWRDGSRAKAIETEFGLRGRVRRQVAPFWAALMLALKDVPSRRLVIGSDGYLFYRERIDVDPDTRDRGTAIFANLASALNRSLAAGGTNLIAAPLPRKAVTCAAKLPEGLEIHATYDASVIRALKDRGVPTLDLLSTWTEGDGSRMFLPHDSHWSRAGVESFAAELMRQFPGLPRGERTLARIEGPLNLTIGSLGHAGILPRHPAYDLVKPRNERMVFLDPPTLQGQLDRGETPSRISLAGSSFCEGYFAQAILAHALQAGVADFSLKGRPPLSALYAAITSREPGSLPEFAIAEFPVHQVATVDAGASVILQAATGMMEHAEPAGRLRALDASFFPWRKENDVTAGRPWVQFPGGSLLSSGDGALRFRLRVQSDAASRWRVASGGMTLSFRLPPGKTERTLPLIEAERLDGVFWLAPLDETAVQLARAGRAQLDVLAEASWENGRAVPGAAEEEGAAWSLQGRPMPVEPLDSLVARWDAIDARASLDVTVAGERSDGSPFERTWSFRRAGGAKILCVSLQALAGGSLTAVRLNGAEGMTPAGLPGLQVRLAPGRDSR